MCFALNAFRRINAGMTQIRRFYGKSCLKRNNLLHGTQGVQPLSGWHSPRQPARHIRLSMTAHSACHHSAWPHAQHYITLSITSRSAWHHAQHEIALSMTSRSAWNRAQHFSAWHHAQYDITLSISQHDIALSMTSHSARHHTQHEICAETVILFRE